MHQLLAKLPPSHKDIEQAVLGTILLDPSTFDEIVGKLKTPDVFYFEPHRIMFSAICEMATNGNTISPMALCAKLDTEKKLEQVGGNYSVMSLLDNASPDSESTYTYVLLEAYMRRELIRICGQVGNHAYRNDCNVFELIATTEQQIDKITDQTITSPFYPVGHLAEEDMEELQQRVQRVRNNDGSLSGADTGYRTLNRITNGWQKGDMIVLAARPSVGKTAFSLNLALACMNSVQNPMPVGFFSLEMDTAKLRMRLMAMINNIGLTNISSGQLTDHEMGIIAKSLTDIKRMPLYIDDSSNNTILDIRTKARQMKRKHNVGLIIIDYLQLITPTKTSAVREVQVSEISREIKKLAKELQIPIIALSQLNRSIESRTDKEPNLSDLRESGAIEQDADLVSFLYRFDDKTMLKIAKHRNGKTDICEFSSNLDLQKFYEYGATPPEESAYKGFQATSHSGNPPKLMPFNFDNDVKF